MKKIDFNKIIGYFNPYGEGGAEIKVLRDWKVLFFCSLALFVALLAVDFGFFREHGAVDEAVPDALTGKGSATLNQRDIGVVLDELDAKERNFKMILSAPEAKDPSL